MKKFILALSILIVSCKDSEKPNIRNNYNQIGQQKELQLIKSKIDSYSAYGQIDYNIKFEKNQTILEKEGFGVICEIFANTCTIEWN